MKSRRTPESKVKWPKFWNFPLLISQRFKKQAKPGEAVTHEAHAATTYKHSGFQN